MLLRNLQGEGKSFNCRQFTKGHFSILLQEISATYLQTRVDLLKLKYREVGQTSLPRSSAMQFLIYALQKLFSFLFKLQCNLLVMSFVLRQAVKNNKQSSLH